MRNRPLQHTSGGLERLQRLLVSSGQPSAEAEQAAALLGSDHQLARIIDLAAVLRRQLVLSSLALAGGAIALGTGTAWAPALTLSASVVEVVLVATIAVLASLRRTVVHELLISGPSDLPLQVLNKERHRLTSPRTRARLARSLKHIVHTTAAWPRNQRSCRPIFDPRVVRAAAPLLTHTATLLQSEPPPPQAAARIERLLTNGNSALYGHTYDELRDELELIVQQLEHCRKSQ